MGSAMLLMVVLVGCAVLSAIDRLGVWCRDRGRVGDDDGMGGYTRIREGVVGGEYGNRDAVLI